MASLQRSVIEFLGTLVVLAWALHEVAYLHELSVPDKKGPA